MKRLVLMIVPALICGAVFTSCVADKAQALEDEGVYLTSDNSLEIIAICFIVYYIRVL